MGRGPCVERYGFRHFGMLSLRYDQDTVLLTENRNELKWDFQNKESIVLRRQLRFHVSIEGGFCFPNFDS